MIFDERLDGTFLTELYGNDVAYAATVFGSFLEEVKPMMAHCDAALASGDMAVLRKAVHKLKPTLHYVGLTQLGHQLEQIEKDCGDGVPAVVLTSRYEQAASAIRAMLPLIEREKNKLEALTVSTD
jgi:HPt (histidine-containing phosphotransfer) domain-containing protein